MFGLLPKINGGFCEPAAAEGTTVEPCSRPQAVERLAYVHHRCGCRTPPQARVFGTYIFASQETRYSGLGWSILARPRNVALFPRSRSGLASSETYCGIPGGVPIEQGVVSMFAYLMLGVPPH